jgi:hypothetical protein
MGRALGVLQANYTYAHALDISSNGGIAQFTGGSSRSPQDPNHIRGSYGNADYDVRHSFNASYVWDVPFKAITGGRGSDALLKGWQVSGTIFARRGFPYTVFDFATSGELNARNFFEPVYAVPVRPLNTTGNCTQAAANLSALVPCLPPQVLGDDGTPNPGALFVQAGCETGFNSGNLGPSGVCDGPAVNFAQGRNRFRGPSYFNTDFSIVKKTRIPRWENAQLGIGFQFFNLFNHPNFQLPASDIGDFEFFGALPVTTSPPTSLLGAGLGGTASARMIQLRVQLLF